MKHPYFVQAVDTLLVLQFAIELEMHGAVPVLEYW